jgi:fatty-acyl-CoA synthase
MVAAVAQPDPHAGELPVAYVTLKPGAVIGEDELLLAARELVPERAAIPVRIEILPQMVLTAVGKIAKAELRLRAAHYVLARFLAEQGLEGELSVTATPDRGTVVQLRCAAGDIGRASVILAPFPYVIDVQAQDGEQQ